MGAGGARAPPIFRRWGLSPLDYDIMFLTSVLLFVVDVFCLFFVFVYIFRQLNIQ